ncbi:unnamed protein product [Paramecium sonneborni]|uniref:Transmembrane protein n=1 Tax=Paramecium sonneborni TaxID=65129 RepID=A0A8S1NK72_9CILI|nr:unnamed protein product [Paramecium sonneborni]
MNQSHSPVLRPLSNISNRKLTSTNLQTKQHQNFSKSFTSNSVIFPQQFEYAKSTIQEIKTIQNNIISPKSSITSYNSSSSLSSTIDDISNKKAFMKRLNNEQKTKFLLFKILVILTIIAVALLLYQMQANLFQSSNTKQFKGELLQIKQKMIADSISNSIIQTVVFKQKKLNLNKEKNDIKAFYQDEYSPNLWKMVLENVNRDIRIRVEKQDNEEFWTI